MKARPPATLLEAAVGVAARPRAAGTGADPPLVRVRERRPAHQRAPGVPRRLGAERGDHHRAVPRRIPTCPRASSPSCGPAWSTCARSPRSRAVSARQGSARTCCSARARRPPAAATSRASSPTRWRRCSARSTCSTACRRRDHGDPQAVRPADGRGRRARRRAGLEDQPAGADRVARASASRSTASRMPARTTRRRSPPGRSCPAAARSAASSGGSKKEAEQRAAEAAWRELHTRLTRTASVSAVTGQRPGGYRRDTAAVRSAAVRPAQATGDRSGSAGGDRHRWPRRPRRGGRAGSTGAATLASRSPSSR